MPKVTAFTRATHRQIAAEVEAALRTIAERHGLTVKPTRKGFYPNEMPVPFSLHVGEQSQAESPDARALKVYADQHGLGEDAYGKTFMSKGKRMKIVGYRPKSPKFPVLCQDIATKRIYKFTIASVKALRAGTREPVWIPRCPR